MVWDFGFRGQPLSLKLSFGEILWFDVWGDEKQRCDWFKSNPQPENSYQAHTPQKRIFRPITALYFPPYCTSNHEISPSDSVSDSG
jgi:hypothetical protein